jgi:hypothetical protein
MRNPSKWICLWTLLIAVSIVDTACNSQPSPVAKAEPTKTVRVVMPTAEPTATLEPTPTAEPTPGIRVALAEPVQHELDSAEVHMRNCGVWTEWREKLGSEFEIQSNVAIGPEATSATGAVVQLPEEIKAQLAAEVQSAYQQAYEAAKAKRDSIELVAGPNTDYIYIILWVENTYSSTVAFQMDSITYTVPYTYTLRVPKQAGFRELGCSG